MKAYYALLSKKPHRPAVYRQGDPSMKFNHKNIITVALVFGALAVVYLIGDFFWKIREIGLIHGPLFLYVKFPSYWIIPTIAGVAGLVISLFIIKVFMRGGGSYSATSYGWGIAWFFAFATIAWVPTAIFAPKYSDLAIYKHYNYTEIKNLPSGGEVRIVPQEVAVKLAMNGYNDPGHQLSNAHIVRDPRSGKLVWTFEQAPNGGWNSLFKQTVGIAVEGASETTRTFAQIDRKFKFAPSMAISQTTEWQLNKHHYFTGDGGAVATVTKSGEPIFVQPYIVYKGGLWRYPTVGGVRVYHASGVVEDLTVAQAAKRPEIVGSGRIIPASLARAIQDAYAYKHGVANTWFGHRDQTQIQDSSESDNHQPYLMSFNQKDGTQKLYWVSSAEPYGKSYSTRAIFLTDAVTGNTQIWMTPKGEALTGANQAIQVVKSLAISGIVFGDKNGQFKVVEPRPVFFGGKLYYLLSIIPVSANSVTKSVIVDAQTNKAVAIFNHDTDPTADQRLTDYLRTGKLESEGTGVIGNISNPDNGSSSTSGGNETLPTDASTARILQALIDNNRKLQADLNAQNKVLLQLQAKLRAANKK